MPDDTSKSALPATNNNSAGVAASQVRAIDWSTTAAVQLSAHIERRYLHLGETTIARFFLAKGAVVAEHHHPQRQLAIVVSGALRFTLADQIMVVRGGEVLCIPPDVPHSALALEDTIDIDVFTPRRIDWDSAEDAYLRQSPLIEVPK